MATGNDLNPCRVVDVEWRWAATSDICYANSVPLGRDGFATLQTRKLVRDDQGRTEWTEWQDMPVVEV